MNISGNPILTGSNAIGIGVNSKNDAGKGQPCTCWGRIVSIAVDVLSMVGFLTGLALAFTVTPIAGAVIAAVSASVLIGKSFYNTFVRKTPGLFPGIRPGSYAQKKRSSNSRPAPLQSNGANELTCFPSLNVAGELPAGASGARVYHVRDHNNRSMVLKIHRHGQDVLPNFLLNEGRVQQQVSQGTRNLLPAIRLHGTIKGAKLDGLITDSSFIRPDEKYTVILSDYIEHKSLMDLASSSSERLSPNTFRRALADFARNMRHAIRAHQFEHNDSSRNLIYTRDGRIMLIDTGLSATRDYPFQGHFKGNPYKNILIALNIAYQMAGSNLDDPFYKGMKAGSDFNRYWHGIKNTQGTVDCDLAEFNTLLLYFPDIRQKIMPGGNPENARLLSWDECISALESSTPGQNRS